MLIFRLPVTKRILKQKLIFGAQCNASLLAQTRLERAPTVGNIACLGAV